MYQQKQNIISNVYHLVSYVAVVIYQMCTTIKLDCLYLCILISKHIKSQNKRVTVHKPRTWGYNCKKVPNILQGNIIIISMNRTTHNKSSDILRAFNTSICLPGWIQDLERERLHKTSSRVPYTGWPPKTGFAIYSLS